MIRFGHYVVENNLSNLSQFKRSVQLLVGPLLSFSYSGHEMDPAETDKLGPVHLMTYILARDRRKAFRLVLKNGHPVAVQTWTNFGFTNSEMHDPDHTFDLKAKAMHLDDLAKTVAHALGAHKMLSESYGGLSPKDREAWRKLRAMVMQTAGKLTRDDEERRYGAMRRRLGVTDSTFEKWAGRHVKPKMPFERPAEGPRRLSRHGDVGKVTYVSPIAKLREKGETTALERVQKIDNQTRMVAKTLKAGQGTSALIAGRGGTGKCFGRGTPILMYDGTIKPVEEVREGDLVMGNDSSPRRAYGCTHGTEMMFNVVPTKGDPFWVNESHILSVKYKGRLINLTVKDYLDRPAIFKRDAVLYRTSIDFPVAETKLPIDPYHLGLWLGDGNTDHHLVTNVEPEVIEYLQSVASWYEGYVLKERRYGDRAPGWSISKEQKDTRNGHVILDALREIGVLGNKHIPHQFLTASREDRLQLLAGLIDTDGYYDPKCHYYEISQKSQRLAKDILYLCRSLGLAAYASNSFKAAQTGIVDIYSRICISGDLDIVPSKVRRKQARKRQSPKNVLHVGFRVHPVGEDEYFGFAVDGNHLFCLGDFTVVHNTFLIRKELGEENRGKTWEIFSGDLTRRSLYLWLYRNRKGKVLVLDDVPIFNDEGTAQMLKAALNTNPNAPRIIGWMSKNTQSMPKEFVKKAEPKESGSPFTEFFKDERYPTPPEPKTEVDDPPKGNNAASSKEEWYAEKDREYEEAIAAGEEDKWKPPANFQFEGRVIFITNKPMQAILDHPHLNALATRSISPVDYDFDDEEMLAKMKQIYPGVRKDMEAAYPGSQKALYDLISEGHRQRCFSNLSLRTYENTAAMYMAIRQGGEDEKSSMKQIAQMMRDGLLS